MKIDEIEFRVIELPYRSPFRTSFGEESGKHCIIATVRSEGVEGYGESVMDLLPAYREESLVGALNLLVQAFGPDLLQHGCAHPSELGARWSHWRGNPMAKTTLELAVWDCFARQQGVPLRTLLGGDRTEIPVGASLGINEPAATVENVRRHVEQGYKRVKLKIEPGWDIAQLEAVRAEDDMVDHAQLARELTTMICLDETLTSPARVRASLDLGACAVVNVKVGRVGGLQAVREIHDLCMQRDVPMWCGGMLETGIGRAANLALAAMPGFTLPGDTSASARYFHRDVTEPFVLREGHLDVPTGAGIGIDPDMAYLDEITDRVDLIAVAR